MSEHGNEQIISKYVREHGCEIVEFGTGIYYIEGKAWFPTQIVVTDELDKASHIWVKGLSDNLNKEDFREMLDERKQMKEKADRELADSVLEVSISANKEMVDELIGDESMYEALMEIMEPRIKQREDAIMKRGIQITVKSLKDFGADGEEIRKAIIKNYGLSETDAEGYL